MNEKFQPVFVVGAPRSGTTLLAVLLNRHSTLAFPPETQFFTEFLPAQAEDFSEHARRDKVRQALSFNRIEDLGLTSAQLLAHFRLYDNTPAGLFRALLEAYAEQQGKQTPGEKSPGHLEHVPQILSLYPSARIVCIVRDGRDVVRSLLKTPWAEPDNPRRFGLFCSGWSDYARLARSYLLRYPSKNFKVIRYEDLLSEPDLVLQAICDFLGIQFQSAMLLSEQSSGVVPDWEAEWKDKAGHSLDPNRAFAWRKSENRKQLWRMNGMMARELKSWGYPDVHLAGCPLYLKLGYFLGRLPYLQGIRPLSLLGLKLWRILRGEQMPGRHRYGE